MLRFRDLGALFSRFGCFVLRSSFSSASFSKLQSLDMPKPRFASSISQSTNDFFSSFFILKKAWGRDLDGQRSLSYLDGPAVLISSCSDSPYRPYNKPAFLALIPPSFASLNPFVIFFRPLQPHFSSHNWGKYENSRFNSHAFVYI